MCIVVSYSSVYPHNDMGNFILIKPGHKMGDDTGAVVHFVWGMQDIN